MRIMRLGCRKAINNINQSTLTITIGYRNGKFSFITAAYQADSCIIRLRVEGRAEIILSADYDFAVMEDGRDTGGRRSSLLVVKVYKSSALVNTMTKEKTTLLYDFVVYTNMDMKSTPSDMHYALL